MGIFSKALESVERGYYRVREGLGGSGLTSAEHYIFVKGPVRVYSTKIRDFVRVAVIERTEMVGDWRCFASSEDISLERLKSYERVDRRELPWNKGERVHESTLLRRDSDTGMCRLWVA